MDILILSKLEANAKLTTKELAELVEASEKDVQEAVERLERDRVICGYRTLIDWEKTDKERVSAIIELKVTPSYGQGFDKIAERICQFDEASAVYLMSGGYDLMVMVEGKTMKDVAFFVTNKLASLKYVLSTATHFVLKNYKNQNENMDDYNLEVERMIVSP